MDRTEKEMGMNCKQGDLAVVVRGVANLGVIVKCERLARRAELDSLWYESDEPIWVVDGLLLTRAGRRLPLAPDSFLRPIRPGDISDEEVRDLYAPKLPEHA
jgi:hypothetical protein